MPMPPYRALPSSCKKTTLFFDFTGGSRWNHLPVQKALYFLFTKKNALERAFYNSFVYLSPFIYDLSRIQKEFCQGIFCPIIFGFILTNTFEVHPDKSLAFFIESETVLKDAISYSYI